jgi:hypothetical protein
VAGALAAWATSEPHWAERHVLPSYCATGPGGRGLARAAPWLAAGLGAATALGLVRVAGRWIGRGAPLVRASSLVGIGAAVAGSLLVAELTLRRIHGRLTRGDRPAGVPGELAMTRPDARLGWSYFPGRTTVASVGGRLVSYAIDAEGDRAAASGDVPDAARPTVVFAGESIAFGYGLPYEETIPFLVGHDLGVQTVNAAVIGYGSDQAHLRLVDALSRHRRPLAAVTVFIPDQLDRNVDVWRPRLVLGEGGALALAPPDAGPRLAKLLQELPVRSGEALRVTAAILRASANAARARGAFPLFVVTNYGPACAHGEAEEPWIVEELFVRQGLPFVRVDLRPDERLPGVLERHPNLLGTRRIADAVERALKDALGSRLAASAAATDGR